MFVDWEKKHAKSDESFYWKVKWFHKLQLWKHSRITQLTVAQWTKTTTITKLLTIQVFDFSPMNESLRTCLIKTTQKLIKQSKLSQAFSLERLVEVQEDSEEILYWVGIPPNFRKQRYKNVWQLVMECVTIKKGTWQYPLPVSVCLL